MQKQKGSHPMNTEALLERVNDLTGRVALLEDDRAIRELLSRYGYYADLGRDDDWINLFTPDGEIEVAVDASWLDGTPGSESTPEGDRVLRGSGPEGLRTFIEDPKGHQMIVGRCLHLMNQNLSIRVDGDVATAESYNITLIRKTSRTELLNGSLSHWSFERHSTGWLIKSCIRRRPGAKGFGHFIE
jgi:hypothetical protein